MYQEGIHGFSATNVQIQVDTPIIVENKIPNDIGSLDRIVIVVISIEKPGIVSCDEFTRAGVCPQLVFATISVRWCTYMRVVCGCQHTNPASYRDKPGKLASNEQATSLTSMFDV